MNYFYGVYPADKRLARLFDLARLILQPDFARKAHITLRGPYQKRPSPRSKWMRMEIEDAYISRPDMFFNDWQNTVYLRVTFLEDKYISWKKDFEDSVPHMSIYDGTDRTLAWQVLLMLREFKWDFRIELTPVQILERKKDFERSFFLEIDDIDIAFEYISEKPLSRSFIRDMRIGQRVHYLKRICECIHEISYPSSALI